MPVVEFIELGLGGNVGDLGGGSCPGTLQMRRQAADAIVTILSERHHDRYAA